MNLRIRELLSGNRILQMILATAAAVLCLMVWPFRVFYHETVSDYRRIQPLYTGAVTMEEIVLQQFMPSQDYLAGITIQCALEDVHPMDRVFVTLYDAEFNVIYQEVPFFTEIEKRGAIVVSPELSVTPGALYYVGLNVHFESVGTLQAAYGAAQSLEAGELLAFSYASVPYENMCLMMTLRYTHPFSVWLIICCILGILAGCAAIYAILVLCKDFLQKKNLWDRARRILLLVFFGAVEAGVLAAAWFLCAARFFGGESLDVAVYAAASVTMLVLTGYACYRTVFGKGAHGRKKEDGGAEIAWSDYLQTVCIAVLLWAGIRYVDAEIQWKQDLARNWVYLLFGIFVVLSAGVRRVFCLPALIWGILMIPGGIWYYRFFGMEEHQGGVAVCFAAAVFVWGLVLIGLIRDIRRQSGQKTCVPLAVSWLLMCVLMIVNRYGKEWPVFMAVSFTLFYLNPYTEKQRRRIMDNFMRGVIIQFLWMWVMSLCHRPYHYYQYNRYPMYFHTVASTGMYLAMVEAVVLVRLFLKIRETGKIWRHTWKEWLLGCLVSCYVLLSMVRTAFLAIAGMGILLAVAAAVVYRPRVRNYFAVLIVFCVSTLTALPTVYTLTRCVPAVVNRPVYFGDPEIFSEAVMKGEKPDSPNYMNVRGLLRLWSERIGMPDALAELIEKGNGSGGGASRGQDGTRLRELCTLASAGEPHPSGSGDISFVMAGGALTEGIEEKSAMNELSNGRLGIYKAYISRLNLSGHEEMGIDVEKDENGWSPGHAHNSFLQNAYDFGIPAGILYVILVFGMIGRSVYLIWSGKDRSRMQYMALVMLSCFVLVSLTEYSSNPCMPLGFASFFVLFTMRRQKDVV